MSDLYLLEFYVNGSQATGLSVTKSLGLPKVGSIMYLGNKSDGYYIKKLSMPEIIMGNTVIDVS